MSSNWNFKFEFTDRTTLLSVFSLIFYLLFPAPKFLFFRVNIIIHLLYTWQSQYQQYQQYHKDMITENCLYFFWFCLSLQFTH